MAVICEVSLHVRFRLRDRASLESYFQEHAPRMRGDGLAHFGEGFRAERRIMVPLDR